MRLHRIAVTATLALATMATAPGSAAATQVNRPAGRTVSVPAATTKINWGKPVFTDNFNGTKLNVNAWSIYNDPAISPPAPRRTRSSVRVRDGSLELIGHRQKPYGYVSGGISYKTNQTYGRWVVRFRADAGAGYAPVVLLWPQGPWQPDGEIDMVEITNPQRRGGAEFLHLGNSKLHLSTPTHRRYKAIPPTVNFTRWHTLAVDWLPSHVTFWLDGRKLWTVERGTGANDYIPSTPFHLALQNDEGCDVHCKPNKDTPKQVIMRVDWVKIYAAPHLSRPSATLADPGSKGVRGVAYSPDGKYIAAADGNGRTYLRAAARYRLHATLTDPASRGASSVAFSPDSSTMAIGDSNGHAYVSGPGGDQSLADPASRGVTGVAFSTGSHYLAAGDANGHTYVWTVATGKVLGTLPDRGSQGVRAVAYSPDGKLLATADRNGHVYVWALPDYKLRATLTDPASRGVTAVAFSTGSHYLAAGDANGRTVVYRVG
jgi:WD40 repeat protein